MSACALSCCTTTPCSDPNGAGLCAQSRAQSRASPMFDQATTSASPSIYRRGADAQPPALHKQAVKNSEGCACARTVGVQGQRMSTLTAEAHPLTAAPGQTLILTGSPSGCIAAIETTVRQAPIILALLLFQMVICRGMYSWPVVDMLPQSMHDVANAD